jgi:hypothetical protein
MAIMSAENLGLKSDTVIDLFWGKEGILFQLPALLNNGMIFGRSPTSELISFISNQGFKQEVGDLGCLSILAISNAQFPSLCLQSMIGY